MPGSVRVKVLSARGLPVMDRSTLLTDAFVEICIGTTSYRTDVIRRSLNPSWNSDWFCFELDDRTLQEEALILKVMDHDTYSAHDTIGRVYFDLNPLLNRGKTRALDGWFPIYDTMHGIRGELSLSIRVDVFLDASRYESSSMRVKFLHSRRIPSGYVVEFLIGFVQELVMSDDPEHQWIEKIRTSRASNEARQRLFSRLSGELQRKLGLKVLNLGGNSVVGYQLHFDLEGETGVVVRGIGTALRLRKLTGVQPPSGISIPIGESDHRTISDTNGDHFGNCEPASLREGELPGVASTLTATLPQPLGLGEFPFLTISRPAPGMIQHFGGIVAAKSVKLMDKSTPAGIHFRDAWWFELRTEVQQHMHSVHCNAVIGYREECAIYEDVCILSSYGTAVILHPTWVYLSTIGAQCFLAGATKPRETQMFIGAEQRVSPSSSGDLMASNITPLICDGRENALADELSVPPTSLADSGSAASQHPMHPQTNRRDTKDAQNVFCPDCAPCHVPRHLDSSSSRLPYFSTNLQRCAICKSASVPDLLLSSSDLPPEIQTVGGPALIQAFACRSKKDCKGDMAANELSEILPFMEFEIHYWLTQKLRLRGMNAICELQFRVTIGESYIACIASGTGVFISALPSPRPPGISQTPVPSVSPEERLSRTHIKDQVDEYVEKSRRLFGITIPDTDVHNANGQEHTPTNCTGRGSPLMAKTDANDTTADIELDDSIGDTMFLETRDPEPEELALLLRDPLPPSGLLLATTESVHCFTTDNVPVEPILCDETHCFPPNLTSCEKTLSACRLANRLIPLHSFIRLHEDRLTAPDSVVESTGVSPVSVTGDYPCSLVADSVKLRSSVASCPNRQETSTQISNLGVSKRSVSVNMPNMSPMSSLNVPLAGSSVRNRPDQPIVAVSPGCCLRDVMRELNQLTWFRFRRLIPCAITALDFRLILTDDDSIQIVTAGMVSVPVPATRTCASSYRPVSDTVSHSSNAHILGVDVATCDESLFEGGVIDYGSHKAMDCSETQQPVDSSRTDPAFQNNLHGCLLTPLSCVPGMVVDTYLGNLDFFFVRETNDLKEAGGIRGFLHTGLAEVQAVVGAHTSSLGGNVLLSYHLSEVHIFRTASRNHAQCLFNVCGDMARLSPIRVQ